MLKIGILLPRSTYYQTIGFDIFEGLKSGLDTLQRNDLKVVTENIGFGADKQTCYRCAEKLLLEENVSIVLAYIGHRTAELLRPLFLAANKILIVLDAGANLPNEWPKCPNIIFHSLHNALGAWLTARKATQDGYLHGGMVTGYYDGGYLQTYSISKSFETNQGQIKFNHATGYVKDDFTMKPLEPHLNENDNSALLTIFSGDYTQWFFEDIKHHYGTRNLPIYMTPFGLEEMMLESAVLPSNRVKGIVSWSKKLENKENKDFLKSMEDAGRKPNMFSLLGWESASLACIVVDLIVYKKKNLTEILTELETTEFESPRGKIEFDIQTNTTLAPMYEVILIDNNGFCETKIEGQIDDTKTEFEKLAKLPLNGATSAWHNSYTCI
jgi:branched-chain amino acid transport system substrate-binding protein